MRFSTDRFLGAWFQALPVELSEKRYAKPGCFGTLDDVLNWDSAKYLIAEGDTSRAARFDESWEFACSGEEGRGFLCDKWWSVVPEFQSAKIEKDGPDSELRIQILEVTGRDSGSLGSFWQPG